MSIVNKINVSGTEYDIRDNRVRFEDGADFDYGTLVQGGINNTNGYTTGTVLRRSETYWPVIEGPANIVMSNGLTGYIRLYDADKTMIDPGEGMPGSDTTNHVLVIAQNSTLTLTMKEYNPNTAYFRFYFSCGTKDNISALVRENARIVPLQTVATSGEMQMLSDDVSDLKSAINGVVGVNNLFNSTIEHAEFFKKIQNTINVSSTSWITIAPESQVIVNCTQNEKFIVLAKLKSNVSQDYVYRVRLRKYDSSGGTGTYYFSDDFYSSIMAQITASGSDVTRVALQLVRKYTGSAENNFSETFDLEYLILIRGDITLSDLVKTHFSIDDIPDGSISPAKLTPLTDRYDMILRYGVKCPNYDTVNHQLTIYKNTVIVDLLDNTELIRLDADVVLDAPSTTQVSELSYATTTGVFQLLGQVKQYTSQIYLGSINRTSGLGHLKCAHTINGYPVGSDLLLADIAEKLPNNWVSKIEEINTAKTNKFTFAVQTDTHYVLDDDVNYGNNLKSLTNHVGFDFVVNMGDVIQGYADEIINNPANSRSAMTQIMHRYVTGISCPLLIAMGNHDTNKMWADAYGGNPFSFDEVWGREFRPAFNTNPKAEFKTGIMYYYTDFNDIRVIVLNTQDGANGGFGIGQAQIGWLTNTALDTDKAVLIVSHVPLINGWSVSSNYVSSYADAVAAIKAFQVNGGTVIGCFSGHTHTQETQKVDGLLYVTFRNGGSLSEVVMVDLENKTVDTIPVGFTGLGNRSFTF